MKKILCVLAVLFLFPLAVNAESVNTSFNDETCVLTVSGSKNGHEATVSIFKNNEFAGLKTNTIENGNYSVDFVLAYDTDTTINITVSNEAGGNEIEKNNVVIPACNAPEVETFNELFDDKGNSLIKKQGEYEDGDHFNLEDIDDESMQEMLAEMPEEQREVIENLYNIMLNKVGDYREFLKVLNVIVKDRNNSDKYFEDYNNGFILNIKIPKEIYNELQGLKFALFDDQQLTLSDSLDYFYDEEQEFVVLEIDRPCTLIAYIDNDYEFLDNTENPTFNPNKDDKVRLRINALYSKFKDVYVDGKKLSKDKYEDKDGSTIITFKKDYLNSLSNGNHIVTVYFSDGKATTNLKVGTNPLTGDKIFIYTAILLLSIIGVVIGIKKKKKI